MGWGVGRRMQFVIWAENYFRAHDQGGASSPDAHTVKFTVALERLFVESLHQSDRWQAALRVVGRAVCHRWGLHPAVVALGAGAELLDAARSAAQSGMDSTGCGATTALRRCDSRTRACGPRLRPVGVPLVFEDPAGTLP